MKEEEKIRTFFISHVFYVFKDKSTCLRHGLNLFLSNLEIGLIRAY